MRITRKQWHSKRSADLGCAPAAFCAHHARAPSPGRRRSKQAITVAVRILEGGPKAFSTQALGAGSGRKASSRVRTPSLIAMQAPQGMQSVPHLVPGGVLPHHLAAFIQPLRGNIGFNSRLFVVEIITANALQRASYRNTVCRSRLRSAEPLPFSL
jgi:hypothetical protein